MICVTEHVQGGSGMRARLTLEFHSPYHFDEVFELASPGKELVVLFTNKWTRRPLSSMNSFQLFNEKG